MKTQKVEAQGLCLQKSNNRWKWMAGATAAAAGITAAQASPVTVTLSGNYIDLNSGNNLSSDLAGDATSITNISNAGVFSQQPTGFGTSRVSGRWSAHANIAGYNIQVRIGSVPQPNTYQAQAYFKIGAFHTTKNLNVINYRPVNSTYASYIFVPFKDPNINGDALTNGRLNFTLSASMFDGSGNAKIQLDSFTYDQTASVPDQCSTLALLALGAGGILAFRKRRKAA